MTTTTKKKMKRKLLPAEGIIIGALLLSIAWVIPAVITSAGPTYVIPAASATTDLAVTIEARPTSGTAPLTVEFVATATGGESPYTYRWDFGDGSTSTQGPTVSHTYSQAGTYTATTTVTDSNGRTAPSNSLGITVNPTTPPPADNCLGATITGTSGVDNLVGTQGADIIKGLGGNDNIAGLGGNDIICGGNGGDTIAGGAGNDQMFGEAGADSLAGGTGIDSANGGGGTDTCSAETRTACEP